MNKAAAFKREWFFCNHIKYLKINYSRYVYLYRNDKNSVFIEFVLDDFQIEKKVSGDLEPTEFGFLLDIKKKINNYIKFVSRLMGLTKK